MDGTPKSPAQEYAEWPSERSPSLANQTPQPCADADSGQPSTRSNTPQEANPLNPQAKPTSSPHQPHQPHQQYLDSLQPPSDRDFARLCSAQEDREGQHRHRDNELRRRDKAAARKSMEARRDFMKSKVLADEEGDELSDAAGSRRDSALSRPVQPSSVPQSHASGAGDEDGAGGSVSKHRVNGPLEAKAATAIQRTYRGYRVRREIEGLGLDASTRWTHAIRDAQWKEVTKPRAREDTALGAEVEGVDSRRASRLNARRNWMKAATIARRAGGDEDSDRSVLSDSSSSLTSSACSSSTSPPNSEEWARMDPAGSEAARRKKQKAQAKRRKHARVMGLQYFLEMVDLKHRYGSNLRTYHEEWKRSDTNENFFYWLDYGEGRDLDLAACPRERLDRECVRYLSREERQHYLVRVDHEGRLVWAKNGIRIDTTEEWKDSIHGIVPADDPTPAFSPAIENHMHDQARRGSGSQSSSPSQESELEAARAAKYANTDLDGAKGVAKLRHVSAAAVFNKLLRKSVRKNTWIFVADTSFRLYVGIKASGAFQHSSFLRGGRISAAGLIKVRDGRLSSLSPLSGHYRPPAANFRAFVRSLEGEGADMSRVSVSRSYAVLVGLEAYVKARRKGKEALRKAGRKKTELLRPDEARRMEEEAWDKSQSAARERRVLERERAVEERKREENKATVKILQKLGIRPRTPAGQRDSDPGAVGQGE